MKLKTFLISLFITICANGIAQQQQQLIGISLNSDFENKFKFKPGFGVMYEYQLKKHHGFEIGLNFKTKTAKFLISGLTNEPFLNTINEFYLAMPVMYKFYTNIVNLSTGITFDYFIGWDDVDKVEGLRTISYSIEPKLNIGWAFKVGKTIKLSPKFVIEPEIQINPVFKYDYLYYGAAVKLKYKL
ncbi:MAG: outer membrane beta-barrel protein [Paludibacter sp.]|nr:outer membrane beta-barrel protein [Paludibacter sp.]